MNYIPNKRVEDKGRMKVEKVLSVLSLEDSEQDFEIIREQLTRAGYNLNISRVEKESEFAFSLHNNKYDIILADFNLPGFDAFAALHLRNEICPDVPFVCVSGVIGEETAIELMKNGAVDYILKDKLKRLPFAIKRALDEAKGKEARRKAEVNLLRTYRALNVLSHCNQVLVRATKETTFLNDICRVFVESGGYLLVWIGFVEHDKQKSIRPVASAGFNDGYIERAKISWEDNKRGRGPSGRAIRTKQPIICRDTATDEYFAPWRSDAIKRGYSSSVAIPLMMDDLAFGVINVYAKETNSFDTEEVKLLQEVATDLTFGIKSLRIREESKSFEEELIKAKDKAEESDRLKTAFLHNISHEIRTPMNAIIGFSALLGEPNVDEQTRQSYIEVIMQSSNHLLEIMTDIVDISNIEANLIKIAKSEVDLNATIKRVCDQFTTKADEKKLSLTYETSLGNSDALILTDGTKLFQILSNLVSNALKFTNTGHIRLECKLKDSFFEFCISDTGIGIPKEHHNRIFDRFYQVQNIESRVFEGTGLGLAISKAYVELLGGEIWLSSEQGIGTSFFFTIPYEKPVVEASAIDGKEVSEGFVFPVTKTVLVAEDFESNFKLIKFFLSSANINIIRATNGKEAVEKTLAERNIDLILMDIKMPIMDGFTAVKLIREKNITIPIIAQTAYADERERALECGCSSFISKPFDKKGLLQIIHEFI